MAESNLTQALEHAMAEIESLRTRVSQLEEKTRSVESLPDSMLLSNVFLKRSFAVLGHYLVAGLIISVPLYVVIVLIALFTTNP